MTLIQLCTQICQHRYVLQINEAYGKKWYRRTWCDRETERERDSKSCGLRRRRVLWHLPTKLHGVAPQKTSTWIFTTTVKTPNLAWQIWI